jgi:hypothetical protein
VLSEHLNHAMAQTCVLLLKGRNDKHELADTALAGHNLESMRRVWVAMVKLAFRGDIVTTDMIDHLSERIDKATQRRNDTIHRLWYIGYGPDDATSFEVAEGMKYLRDSRQRGSGGVRVSKRDSQDFSELIEEIDSLTRMIWSFCLCVAFNVAPADMIAYEDGRLIPRRE